MPRAMVHPRLKRILSETSSAVSSASPTPELVSEQGKPELESEEHDPEPESEEKDSDAERALRGEQCPESECSMDISDEDVQRNAAARSSAQQHVDKPDDVNPTESPLEVEQVVARDDESQAEAGPSISRSTSPPRSPIPASTSASVQQSPPPPQPQPRLKIKLRLGARPSATDQAPPENVRQTRGRKAKAKAKEAAPPPLKFTLPPRSQASSRLSASRSHSSPSAESEQADDADAESEDEAEAEAEAEAQAELNEDAMEVDLRAPAMRDALVGEMESEGEGEGEGDAPEDEMDEAGAEEESEVLPGGTRSGSSARLTARQAVLASMVGADHVELEATTSSRKKQLTSEEIALRREETARKRKNMSEKKLEDEKTETINRLLKKQSSRSRAKRSAMLGSVVPTPQSPHSGDEADSGEGAGAAVAPGPGEPAASMPGPAWRWVSSRAGLRLGVPDEVADVHPAAEPADPPIVAVRPPAMCDVAGCGETRKYRLVHDFQRGACGMEHLRLLNAATAK